MAYDDLYFSCIDVVSGVRFCRLFCIVNLFCLICHLFFILFNQLVIVGIFTFLYCLAVRFVYFNSVVGVSIFPDEGGETSPKRRIKQESTG